MTTASASVIICASVMALYYPTSVVAVINHPSQIPYNKRLSTVSSAPLNFHLEHYEGPLDLLLDLIRKQQIDIRDIPIASITAQYLEFLQKAREMDLDISAEFVFMAATLIHIKSRMLLPVDPALRKEGETEDDPREELVERLLEHERYKNAAEMLREKRMIEENVWSNPQMKQFAAEIDDPGLAVDMFDLVKALMPGDGAPAKSSRSTKSSDESVPWPTWWRICGALPAGDEER